MRISHVTVLRKERTEEAKDLRRKVGDNGGIGFNHRIYQLSPNIWTNTLTGILKDNYLYVEYEVD